MKRPRIVMTMHPSGAFVSRAVPSSYGGAVGMAIRTHPGTYDRNLVGVTVCADGRVDLVVARTSGYETRCLGRIAEDGLTIERITT